MIPLGTRFALVALFCAAAGPVAAAPGGCPAPPCPAPEASSFELKPGDRVAFLGNGLFEREEDYGYLELALTTRWPDRTVSFRGLGWSGDTVDGRARGYFTRPPEPFERLLGQLDAARPSVLFIAYGANEATEGEDGLRRLDAGLRRLLDRADSTNVRVVLLAPPPHEARSSPVPDPAPLNAALQRAAAVVEQVAAERGVPFIDLFNGLAAPTGVPLTTNGLHLNAAGSYRLAERVEAGLGLPPRTWRVDVDPAREQVESTGTAASALSTDDDGVTFTLTDSLLPLPAPEALADEAAGRRILRVRGLPAGRYALWIDTLHVVTAPAGDWADGIALSPGPETHRAERLRRLIHDKNELFARQYRPTNHTYLTGFRRHEQGRHAEELDELTPLIDEMENEIGRLRLPRPHTYRLVRTHEPPEGR